MSYVMKYYPFVFRSSKHHLDHSSERCFVAACSQQLSHKSDSFKKIAENWYRKAYALDFVGLVGVMVVTQVHIDEASVKVVRKRDVEEASS